MIYKLIADTGLLVLIWMTQLVVYPSFVHYSARDLIHWHGTYTTRISLIVMPLMLAQITLHLISLRSDLSLWPVIALILIVLAWANTFFFAVPLHNQIAAGTDVLDAAQQLVSVNTWRTVCWTLVFIIDLGLIIRSGTAS